LAIAGDELEDLGRASSPPDRRPSALAGHRRNAAIGDDRREIGSSIGLVRAWPLPDVDQDAATCERDERLERPSRSPIARTTTPSISAIAVTTRSCTRRPRSTKISAALGYVPTHLVDDGMTEDGRLVRAATSSQVAPRVG